MRSGTLVGIAWVFGYFAGQSPWFIPWAVAAAVVIVALDIVLVHLSQE